MSEEVTIKLNIDADEAIIKLKAIENSLDRILEKLEKTTEKSCCTIYQTIDCKVDVKKVLDKFAEELEKKISEKKKQLNIELL